MGADFISQQRISSKSATKNQTHQSERIGADTGRLSLYQSPPSTVISIEDFERYAIDRLRGVAHLHLSCCNRVLHQKHSHSLCLLFAVLKGIEEHKAKGFKPHEVQDQAKNLADEHLKVCWRTQHLQHIFNGLALIYGALTGFGHGTQYSQGSSLTLRAAFGILSHRRIASLVLGTRE